MQYLNLIYITRHLFGHKIQIQVLQKKSLRIIYFLNHNAHTSPLFRELNILKLPDKIDLKCCLFTNKYFNKCLPTIFKNCLLSHVMHATPDSPILGFTQVT